LIEKSINKLIIKARYILILLLLLQINSLYGIQNGDSLNKLTSTDSIEDRINLLLQLAENQAYNTPAVSLEYARQALQLSIQHNKLKKMAESYNRMAIAYLVLGDLLNSMNHIIWSNKIAVEYGEEKIAELNKITIGSIYSSAGDYLISIEYFKEALTPFLVDSSHVLVLKIYNNLGKSFLESAQYDSADLYLKKALNLAKKHSPTFQPIILFNLADNYLRQENYTLAENYIQKCSEQANFFNDNRSKIRVLQTNAEILLYHEDPEQAFHVAQKAKILADGSQVNEIKYITYLTFSKVWSALGNSDSAYYYLKSYHTIKESIQNQSVRNRLGIFSFQKSQNEIVLLRQKNITGELQTTNQKNTILSLIVIIILVLTLVLSIVWSRHKEFISRVNLENKNAILLKQKEELEEINQFKMTVFGLIAHDLRSPLMSVATLVQLLKENLISNTQAVNLIPEVEKRIETLNRLMNNMIDWARSSIKDHNKMLQLSKTNVFKLFSDIVDELGYYILQKNLNIQTNINQNEFVILDEQIIRTILRNLISNAIKFSQSDRLILLEVVKVNGEIIFSVMDQGEGMDHHVAENLFGNKLSSKKGTEGETGSGFGLKLCKKLVEIHQGKIWAESMPGEGTTFFFSIPVLSPQNFDKFSLN